MRVRGQHTCSKSDRRPECSEDILQSHGQHRFSITSSFHQIRNLRVSLSDVVCESRSKQALPVRDKGRSQWGYCGWHCTPVPRGCDIGTHIQAEELSGANAVGGCGPTVVTVERSKRESSKSKSRRRRSETERKKG